MYKSNGSVFLKIQLSYPMKPNLKKFKMERERKRKCKRKLKRNRKCKRKLKR